MHLYLQHPRQTRKSIKNASKTYSDLNRIHCHSFQPPSQPFTQPDHQLYGFYLRRGSLLVFVCARLAVSFSHTLCCSLSTLDTQKKNLKDFFLICENSRNFFGNFSLFLRTFDVTRRHWRQFEIFLLISLIVQIEMPKNFTLSRISPIFHLRIATVASCLHDKMTHGSERSEINLR